MSGYCVLNVLVLLLRAAKVEQIYTLCLSQIYCYIFVGEVRKNQD